MIESVTVFPSVQLRHRSAPLLKERERYLNHLLEIGLNAKRVRGTAAYLLHIVRTMELTSLRTIDLSEIEEAGQRWANYSGPERRGTHPETTPRHFVLIAKAWFSFHGRLGLQPSPIGEFDVLVAEFKDAMASKRGLAQNTIKTYVELTQGFLKWVSNRHHDLSCVSVTDVDDFLATKREAGWNLWTLAGQCQALRTFFRYAEEQGWCAPGITRGIIIAAALSYPACAKHPQASRGRHELAPAGE